MVDALLPTDVTPPNGLQNCRLRWPQGGRRQEVQIPYCLSDDEGGESSPEDFWDQ